MRAHALLVTKGLKKVALVLARVFQYHVLVEGVEVGAEAESVRVIQPTLILALLAHFSCETIHVFQVLFELLGDFSVVFGNLVAKHQLVLLLPLQVSHLLTHHSAAFGDCLIELCALVQAWRAKAGYVTEACGADFAAFDGQRDPSTLYRFQECIQLVTFEFLRSSNRVLRDTGEDPAQLVVVKVLRPLRFLVNAIQLHHGIIAEVLYSEDVFFCQLFHRIGEVSLIQALIACFLKVYDFCNYLEIEIFKTLIIILETWDFSRGNDKFRTQLS